MDLTPSSARSWPPTISAVLFLVLLGILFSGRAQEPGAAGTGERSPVLFIAGQSREEFQSYLDDVSDGGRACPRPGGASFYTALNLSGVKSPHANLPGDHRQDLRFLANQDGPLVILIGLWLSPEQLPRIAVGGMQREIEALHDSLRDLKRPVLLRVGYEFDGPHNRYPPDAFIEAWRRIALVMRRTPDIQLVWHSFAMLPTFANYPVTAWYPGDDLVDWIGVSYFQVGAEGYHEAPNRDALVAIAREKKKPLLVAEASPIRYTPRQKTLAGKAYWDYWHGPFLDFIRRTPELRAAAYIQVDWDSQAQHRPLDWGDCRLDRDAHVLEHWRNAARESFWLRPSDTLYEQVRAMANSPGE